jgi:hypothetical protein
MKIHRWPIESKPFSLTRPEVLATLFLFYSVKSADGRYFVFFKPYFLFDFALNIASISFFQLAGVYYKQKPEFAAKTLSFIIV